jgi:hypothetical protein
MKSNVPGLLIVGLLAGPITAQSAVNFSTDTATELIGTFSVTATAVDSAAPSVFDFGAAFCMPVRASRSTMATVGLQCAGAPDDPAVSVPDVLAGPHNVSSVSGMTSSLAGSAVPAFYFVFSDLQDTGGAGGTFSGAFCFSRSPTGCTASIPEPEPAVLGGFYPPLAPPSVSTNLAKAGKTIPLTFYAETSSGPIMDLTAARLTIIGVACESISTAVNAIAQYVGGKTAGLQNLGGGYYQYNWQTSKADRNSCKAVTLALPDTYTTPTSPMANFRFH